jgi:hypothetical protein
MQLPWDEHFREIVIPAWQAYLGAEQRLSDAVIAEDERRADRAKYDVLLEGGAATFYLHHFGEVVLRARPHWLPDNLAKPDQVCGWLSPHCTMMRSGTGIDDVFLLRDVADALKHAILTRRLEEREVSASEAVIVVDRGYGEAGFGDGKYGGIDEVWVLAKSGRRSLSTILQNVIDAWRRVAGIELPPIGVA